jgi:predicted ATPase/DNA-binding XRE family transcriptional regulator
MRRAFGDWLRERRRQLDLTQAELAGQVGCSVVMIRKIEADDRVPSRQVAERLARCLQVASADQGAFVMFARGRAAMPSSLDQGGRSTAVQTAIPTTLLPTPITAFLGRERELAELRRLIEADSARLITIVGPPGIGKTRLSLELAASVQDQFVDGVFFVPLAPVTDPAHVLPTISRVLGLPDRGPGAAALYSALHRRRVLLVLDNFEQITAAAPLVSELLQHAPLVRAIVTSRIALHLSGEHQYAVPPLALPNIQMLAELPHAAEYPAVRLFVTRMRVINPEFALTNENAQTVAEICTRLDGLPLAIELAVARSRLLTPQALLDRLRSPTGPATLQVLTSGPRDLLDHQRTLRSTIQWSYDLLDADERRVFIHLGVFVGAFTMEAAAAVCATPMAAEALESLANQNLVSWTAHNGQAILHLLETIREFALEKLAEAGLLEDAYRRHAHSYVELAHTAVPALDGPEQERWLDRLLRAYPNLEAALEWLTRHDPELGLRCATDLGQFWYTCGYPSEGRTWLTKLLDMVEQIGPAGDRIDSLRAGALHIASFLAFQQGDNQQSATLAQKSLALYQALGDEAGIAMALLDIGRAAFGQANYSEATAAIEESLRINRALQHWPAVAPALNNLALIAKDHGDFQRAVQLHEESLVLYRQLGNRRGQARVLNNMSSVAYWEGDYARAGELAQETTAIYRDLDDRMGLAYALDALGMVAYKQGRLEIARTTLAESAELFRSLHELVGMAMALNDTGLIALAQGRSEEAAQIQRQALELAWSIGDLRRVAFCLEGLAAAIGPAQPLLAARLFGAAARLREEISAPLPLAERASYERWVAQAQSATTHPAFEIAYQEGERRPLEETMGLLGKL